MKKGQLKRIVAGILALLLLVGMVPLVEWIKVEAAPANIREMNLNIDGEIAGIGNPTVPSANTDPWIGSRVYFAQGGGTSYQWRVLSKNTTAYSGSTGTKTMLLLMNSRFNENRSFAEWNAWFNGMSIADRQFLGRMQPQEQAAIIESSKPSDELRTPQKIFLPSRPELKTNAYGFPNTNAAATSRAYGGRTMTRTYLGPTYVIWHADGRVETGNSYLGGVAMLNIELDQILMTSNHTFDKTQAVREVPTYTPVDATRWKLTLLDTAKTVSVTSGKEVKRTEDNVIAVPYTYTTGQLGGERDTTEDVNQISVMITKGERTDPDAEILWYGKLDTTLDDTTKQGIGLFELPSGFDKSQHKVYILAEETYYNASTNAVFTDTASEPYEITIPDESGAGAKPGGAVYVTSGSGTGIYGEGESVTIEATTIAGKRFKTWNITENSANNVSLSLTNNPTDFSMVSDVVRLSAIYETEIPTISLTVDAPTPGQPLASSVATSAGGIQTTPAPTIVWQENSGAVTGNAKYHRTYTATITLKAEDTHYFKNTPVVTMTTNGFTQKSIATSDNEKTLTITYDYTIPKANLTSITVPPVSAMTSGVEPQHVINQLPQTVTLVTDGVIERERGNIPVTWNTVPLTDGSGYDPNNLNAQSLTLSGTVADSDVPSDVEKGSISLTVSLPLVFNDAPTVLAPKANVPSNTYTSNQSVQLSCDTPDAAIYYTLDGSVPDKNSASSKLYVPGSTIDIEGVAGTVQTIKLRAIAYKDKMKPSSVAEYEYVIKITKNLDLVEITNIEAPIAGAALDMDADSATTGASIINHPAVMWSESSTPNVYTAGNAKYSTEYIATVTLQAEAEHQFSSITQAKVNGEPAVAVYNPTNNTLTVTYQFPKTATSKLLNITQPHALSVENGTLFENMLLPDKVAIRTEGDVEVEASVDWRLPSPEYISAETYDPLDINEQIVVIKGYVTCPPTIDPVGIVLETQIQITIRESDYVGSPQETPHEGHYLTDQQVALRSVTNDAKIRYTISTDGNPPQDPSRTDGIEYAGLIPVTGRPGETVRTIIKAIAYKDGQNDSIVETFTYDIMLPKPKYTVTINDGIGSGAYEEGNVVIIMANPPASGMRFKEWQGADGLTFLRGTDKNSAGAEFRMPAYPVTLTAVYEPIPSVHVHEFDTNWTHDATHHWHACTSPGCDGTVQDKGEHTEGQWIVDQMPTETTDGMRHKECTVCGRILKTQSLSATGLSYREIYVVIKGSNQTIQKGADRTATIHIDGELDNFLWVKVQGMTIEEKYYTLKSGSTILTFTEEYISNLAAGTYEVTFGYTNGYGRTTLTIVDSVDSVDSVAPSQNWTNPAMLLIEGHADMPRSPKTGE